ncbi:MAG: 3-isopropylmalate dehydratase small subunit [Chitinivibrionia bacterium]|nr:3-isopropylmalate dehydratase small subunit [Chitinivibrionia bacterium]
MKNFGGQVLFLDRNDINTDEIIPAKYLTEVSKEALKPYLLEDLKLDNFDPKSDALKQAKVIVTKENFGCGSSREHAPWALEVNDIFVVVAENFARIFRQNMFNGGMLAIELPKSDIAKIFELSSEKINCEVDMKNHKLIFNKNLVISFNLSKFDEALVSAGGWVEFADEKY